MIRAVRKVLGNEYILGGFFLTVSGFAANFLNYLFNLLSGRLLGPQGYGEISALFSYLYIFSVPTTIASMLIIKKIGSKRENSVSFAKALESWFWGKLKKLWPLLLLLPLVSFFVPKLTNLSIATGYLLLPLILLTFISSFYGAELQALKLFIPFAVINVAVTGIKFLGAFLTISFFSRLGTISLFILFSTVATLVIYWLVFNSSVKRTTIGNNVIQKKLSSMVKDKELWFIALAVLGVTLLNNLDVIFVKQFFPAEASGLYSAWSLFAKIIFYLVGPISSVIFVFLSSDNNRHHQSWALAISLLILVFAGLLMGAGYLFYPETVINLFFGAKFTLISPILTQAAVFGFFFGVVTLLNNYFIVHKSSQVLILPALLPFYGLILFFLPRTMGAIVNFNLIFSGIIALIYFLMFLWVRNQPDTYLA